MSNVHILTIRPTLGTLTKQQILTGSLILTPLILNGPQLLVGSIVNFLLLSLTIVSHKKNWLILSVIPSLAAITHGAIFRTFTPYLFYLLPIITLGNWIYMYLGQKNIIVAILAKVSILIIGSTILFQLKIIPQVLLNSMGTIQIITASIGGLGAITYDRFSKSK